MIEDALYCKYEYIFSLHTDLQRAKFNTKCRVQNA